CPYSWYKYNNSTCIRTINIFKNFHDAQDYCRERYNADLIYLDTRQKEEFVTRYVIDWNFPAYWIGLKYQLDLQSQLNYLWLATNYTLQDYGYTNWHSQGHNLSYGQCIMTLNQGQQWTWENNGCHDEFTFICEANITTLDVYKGLNYTFTSNITFINYTAPSPQPLNISINLTDIDYQKPLIPTTPKPVQGCPYDGINYNGTCIKMITLFRSFGDARKFCKRHYQGDLVSIETQDKESFILVNLTGGAYGAFWIGLRQYPEHPQHENETWVATGQRILNNNSYTNFDKDNNFYINNFDCGLVIRTFEGYRWVYMSCEIPLIFVCQYDSFIPTTTPNIATTNPPTTTASTPAEESSSFPSTTAILEESTSSLLTDSSTIRESALLSVTSIVDMSSSSSTSWTNTPADSASLFLSSSVSHDQSMVAHITSTTISNSDASTSFLVSNVNPSVTTAVVPSMIATETSSKFTGVITSSTFADIASTPVFGATASLSSQNTPSSSISTPLSVPSALTSSMATLTSNINTLAITYSSSGIITSTTAVTTTNTTSSLSFYTSSSITNTPSTSNPNTNIPSTNTPSPTPASSEPVTTKTTIFAPATNPVNTIATAAATPSEGTPSSTSSTSTLTPVLVLQQIAGLSVNSSIQRAITLLENLGLSLQQQNLNQTIQQKTLAINGIVSILEKTNFITAGNNEKEQLAQQYIDILTTLMQTTNLPGQTSELGFQVMNAEEKLGQYIGQSLFTSQSISAQSSMIAFKIESKTAADLAKTGYELFWQVGPETESQAAIALPKEPFSSLDPGTIVKIKVSLNRELSKYFSSNATNLNNQNGSLVSVILSCTVTPDIPINRNFPLNYTIPHLQVSTVDRNRSCVFWKNQATSWSSSGCRVSDNNSNSTVTSCSCDHLTHFALLLQVQPVVVNVSTIDFTILGYMTYIGSGISIFCIMTTLFVYSLLRLKGERFIVHRNLLLALMVAQVSLIIATTGANHKILCQISAVLLHFFYLATFSWMLVEGIHLYFAIIAVYSHKSKLQIYFGVGWGIPVIVVSISAIVRFDSYGQDERCWLSYENGFIWAFIAPVIAILCANIIIMVAVVKISLAANVAVSRESRNSLIVKSKSLVKATAVLFPILGMTWAFGLIPATQQTIIFSYLFVICNSLQGAFIFLFHCIFNSEVRQAYNIVIRRKTTVISLHQQSSRRKLTTQFSSTGPGDTRFEIKFGGSTLV
ncbi:Adhesion G-protein coupled receptor D1, partial [Trichoplax sp. H2]